MNAQEAATNAKTILVADDNQVILSTLSLVLKSKGYQVLTASDASQTISIARRERPDLILLDISFPPDDLPGGSVPWDGFLIMDWLRRMDEAKDIPVIIISSTDPEKYKERSLAAGAVAYLHKPIDNSELLSAIGEALDEKAG